MRVRLYKGFAWLGIGRSWWLRRTYSGFRVEFRLRQPNPETPARISLGKWQLTWMRDCRVQRYKHYRG